MKICNTENNKDRNNNNNSSAINCTMFEGYPDIVGIRELKDMLHIGQNTALNLLHSGKLEFFRIGKKIKIPKMCVVKYVNNQI